MDYDPVVQRLRGDNQSLSEELQQCQADKDFVWSLWRKLQVANPDITQAVGTVVQREKEKAELKDRKVLEILQIKDDKIEELHSMLSAQGRELQDFKSKRVEQQNDFVGLKNDNNALQERLSSMQDQTRSMKTREQNMDDYNRQVINEIQSEKEVLQKQLLQQERLVKSLEKQTNDLRSELKSNMTQKNTAEVQCKALQKDISNKVSQFEDLLKDIDNAKRLVQKLEAQNRTNLMEIEEKNRELETVRHELSELWSSHHQVNEHATQQAELIRQLQILQQDTQKMLKNQEDAYSIESTSLQQMYAELTTRYDISKKAESELRKEVLNLKKKLFERDDTVVQLQHQLELAQIDNKTRRDLQESYIETETENNDNNKGKIESMMTEIHLLKENLHHKDRIIEDMEQNLEKSLQFNVDQFKESSHSTPIRREYRSVALSPFAARSRSPSPMAQSSPSTSMSPVRSSPSPDPNSNKEGQKKLLMSEAKITDLKVLLSLKCEELNELRVAHDRRLERLKSLQTNYKLVREQLKTFEEDQSSKKKKKKLQRSNPRDLQRENSDAVWNELAFFRNESTTLQTQNMNVQEENDLLRVQNSQNKAIIHELRLALEQEKEELEYQLEERDVERTEHYSSQINSVQKQMEEKEKKLGQFSRELRDVTNLRDKLLQERKVLRSELTELTQTGASYRMEIASLKREIHRLEKHLERGKLLLRKEMSSVKTGPAVTRANRNKRLKRTPRLGQHSRNISSSTDKSSSLYEELNDDDWEEIHSDSEDTLTESDTLGQAIASAAQSFLATPESTSSTTDYSPPIQKPNTKLRFKNAHRSALTCRTSKQSKALPTQPRTGTKTKVSTTKVYRDAATSPVFSGSPTQLRTTSLKSQSKKNKATQQRVDSLQQQLIVLRDSRANALKVVSDLKGTNQQLQSDLNLANHRLKMSKQNIQKLTTDLEKAQAERNDLESRLIKDTALSESKHSDQEWKTLENRLKSSSNEVTRQTGVIRTLRTENEAMSDQVKSLQDRTNRVERDNNQKRSLLEDQKSRLKQARESVNNEASLISDLEARIDQLTDTHDKLKIQFDSAKKRVTVLTKERREHEDRFIKQSIELEKKSKQLSESQIRKQDLESALSDLESTAQQQLHGLASQSEAAIDVAQYQLHSTNSQLQQLHKFVKALVHEVCIRCQQARSLSKHYNQQADPITKPLDRSLLKAQSLARDILNISQSDLDDIMSVDLEKDQWETEIEDEKKKDKKWSKKCEKLLLSQDDFVLPLVDMIMEKMEERQELLIKLKIT